MKLDDKEKQKIIGTFNQIRNKEKQDTYIGVLVKVNTVARHRPKDNSKPKSFLETEKQLHVSKAEVFYVDIKQKSQEVKVNEKKKTLCHLILSGICHCLMYHAETFFL